MAVKILEDLASEPGILKQIVDRMEFSLLLFEPGGSLVEITRNFLNLFSLHTVNDESIRNLLGEPVWLDISGKNPEIRNVGRFENYQVSIEHPETHETLIFRVDGFLNESGMMHTIWHHTWMNQSIDMFDKSIQERLKIHNITRKYIPVETLKKAAESVNLGLDDLPAEIVNLTILFADIAGFTKISEKKGPADVLGLLNTTWEVVTKPITVFGGYIDKFMGDGVLAIFKEPLAAVVAAVEIQNLFTTINEFRKITGEQTIYLRIGINTGEVMRGNVGTPQRMDWTAIGDVVNTASRIQHSSEKGEVLISDSTYEKIKEQLKIKSRKRVLFRGKEVPMTVYFIQSVDFYSRGESRTMSIITESQEIAL